MNILFVDLENVCRSPLAEGLLRKKFADHHLDGRIDSAGFESFNINEPPDIRVVEVAEMHGLSITGKARIFVKSDFDRFDKIFVMDTSSFNNVQEICEKKEQMKKVDYVLNLLPDQPKNASIPNPFFSGTSDCLKIFSLLDAATDKIVEQLNHQ
ncbi:MAG: hypothetical protein JXR71_04610 [Bacteroidales bacterium]|nr:hypothetical protein [Bacteroidales bacterium]